MSKFRILVSQPTNTLHDDPVGEYVIKGDWYEINWTEGYGHKHVNVRLENGDIVATVFDPISIVEEKE